MCQSRCVRQYINHHQGLAKLTSSSMYHANAAFNITTDLLVAALPVRQIWKLQVALKQRVALLIILTLGWL
jgi:hypothetical protein